MSTKIYKNVPLQYFSENLAKAAPLLGLQGNVDTKLSNSGAYGWGARGLQNYLPESDSIIFTNGERHNVVEWIKSLSPKSSHGILFQEQLKPHSEIARICGPRVSSIRVTSARIHNKNTIVSAVWRIPVGSNMVDNFQHGTSGNLLGGVNIANGQITRVVGKINGKIESVTAHPDTGVQFDQYTLPDWSKLTEMCEQAANYLMGMNLHHWDIALTERGPVIIENNEIADLDLHQHANRIGFWSEEIETARRQSYPRYWEQLSWSQKKLAKLIRKVDTFF